MCYDKSMANRPPPPTMISIDIERRLSRNSSSGCIFVKIKHVYYSTLNIEEYVKALK